jgi:hypothetical protein
MGRTIVLAAFLVFVGFAQPHAALAADPPGANAAPLAPTGTNTLTPTPPAPAERAVDKAEEAFDAGRALLKDKRYSDACPKFEESQRRDPASGTLLALAYCQELSGLLATSRASYLAAARLAEREGHRDRQTAALERAQALAPRVSKVTVIVPQELLVLPGFHLLRDGIEFERASFGMAVATDGGSHSFEASAPGRVPWTTTVSLFAEGDQKSLILPVLDSVAPRDSTSTSPAAPSARRAPLPPDASERRSKVTLERVSLGLAAASVVGFAVGTGFALRANSKNDVSNSDGHCVADRCDPDGTRFRNEALSAARASTWAFVAGGALAAASITLYIHANSSSSRVGGTVPSKLQAGVVPGAPGLQLTGTF